MTKFAGKEFPQRNTPLEKYLETFAVLWWSSSHLFFGFGGLFLVVALLFTKFYYLSVLYFVWFAYDHKKCQQGGRRINWVRNLIVWKIFRDYFPIQLIKTADLDPNKNYIMGYHPHGIMSAGHFCNFGTEATNFSQVFPGITPRPVTLEGNFWFPLQREYIMAYGACSVSKESLEYILTKQGKGNAAVIVVGGAAESLDAHPHQAVLTLARRKGFVKIALRFGASLVPIFSFGENDIYEQLPNPESSKRRAFQETLKNFVSFGPPIFIGRGIFQDTFGYMPYRRPIYTVVGKPIDVQKIENPTQEDIDKYHELYLKGLRDIFEKYKVELGDKYKDMVLKFK